MRISSKKVNKFITENPGHWHEGLDEGRVKALKARFKSNSSLLRKFYWPKGKSYLFQDILDDHIFCITKKYFDSV